MNVLSQLKDDIYPLFKSIFSQSTPQSMKLVASDARQRGDYQINGFISLLDLNNDPQTKSDSIKKFLMLLECKNFPWLEQVSSSEDGFINLKLSNHWLFSTINSMSQTLEPLIEKKCIVIDYSAPNIAKEMAVHHMRSTFIGDALARISTALGQRVVRVNHIGDWGTQFGLLLAWIKQEKIQMEKCALIDLEQMYCQAQLRKKEDESFAAMALAEVVALQQGNADSLKRWQQLVNLSMRHNYEIYNALNVQLTSKETCGESFYNSKLPGLIDDLLKKKIACHQDGMVVVFSAQFKQKNKEPLAIILQKSGGGFLYATTDLAAVKYRVEQLHADEIIYCVDARQAQHFELVWEVARRAQYLPKTVHVKHHAFGMMLGNDAKPYKTRSGLTPKLIDLIQEAHDNARIVVCKKQSEMLPDHHKEELIHALAINSIKYADLMRHRATNYKFSWNEALSLEGNTAPYLMYALVRARSILRKNAAQHHRGDDKKIAEFSKVCFAQLSEAMHELLIHLLRWQETVEKAAQDGTPHLICQYLYYLALKFSSFYEKEPILTEKDSIQRAIKLIATEKMSSILSQGLDILGLIAVEQM